MAARVLYTSKCINQHGFYMKKWQINSSGKSQLHQRNTVPFPNSFTNHFLKQTPRRSNNLVTYPSIPKLTSSTYCTITLPQKKSAEDISTFRQNLQRVSYDTNKLGSFIFAPINFPVWLRLSKGAFTPVTFGVIALCNVLYLSM